MADAHAVSRIHSYKNSDFTPICYYVLLLAMRGAVRVPIAQFSVASCGCLTYMCVCVTYVWVKSLHLAVLREKEDISSHTY